MDQQAGTADPMSEKPRSRAIEDHLRDVMNAYMNLELSNATENDMRALATALASNSSVVSVNLSCCDALRDTGIDLLADGLATNSAVTTVRRLLCLP